MVDFTNWGAYASSQLAMATIKEREIEAQLSMAQAEAAVKARNAKTVAAQKFLIADDPAVRKATDDLTEAYALRKALEAVYGGLEAKNKVVSRDLTRRTGMRDMEIRAAKWGT
jgi:hypothetical protein